MCDRIQGGAADQLSLYRVRKTVTPRDSARHLHGIGRCLYTISIGPYQHDASKLVTGLEWARKHFSDTVVLLGDSLCRITLQIQKGLEESESVDAAKQLGMATIASLTQHGTKMPHVIRSSDVTRLPEFPPALELIQGQYQNNQGFRASLEADAESFVKRQEARGRLRCDYAIAISLARKYLVEEIAIYLVLAEQGWLLEVYAGEELSTLAMIMRGDLPAMPLPLQKRINVALSIKPRITKRNAALNTGDTPA